MSTIIVTIAALAIAGLWISRRRILDGLDRVAGPRSGSLVRLLVAIAVVSPYAISPQRALMVELEIAWTAFAFLLIDSRLVTASGAPQKLALLFLVSFSLLLHGWLSSGGPGDLRLNLSAIWFPDLELRWGPAPIAFFRLVGLVVGELRDTQIVWSNLLLSSLLPVLLYGILTGLGASTRAALLAAFITAAHPVLIAFSGVLERQPVYLFAAFGSLLALIGFLTHGGRGRFIAFILGTVLATMSRPEGAQVLIVHAAVLWRLPARRSARRAVATALVALVVLAAVYVSCGLDFGGLPGGVSLAGHVPLLWTVLLDPDFTPLAWIVAAMLGVLWGARRRSAQIALVVVLALDAAWRATGLFQMFVGYPRQVASARYETLLLLPFAIGMALFIDVIRRLNARAQIGIAVVFLALTATTFGPPYRTLLEPFSVDYEYRFLKHYALTLPPRALLYILDSPVNDIGFVDARWVALFAGSAVRFQPWSMRNCDELRRDPLATYLYIGSSCAELVPNPRPLTGGYATWLEDCTALRARLQADSVEEVDVPAHKMSFHEFKDPTVRLGLYRLRDAALCTSDHPSQPPSAALHNR